MLLLWVEVVKAARPAARAMMDHVLSFILFAGMAAELVLVPAGNEPTLLLLAVLGFVDVLGRHLDKAAARGAIVLEDRDQAHD